MEVKISNFLSMLFQNEDLISDLIKIQGSQEQYAGATEIAKPRCGKEKNWPSRISRMQALLVQILLFFL